MSSASLTLCDLQKDIGILVCEQKLLDLVCSLLHCDFSGATTPGQPLYNVALTALVASIKAQNATIMNIRYFDCTGVVRNAIPASSINASIATQLLALSAAINGTTSAALQTAVAQCDILCPLISNRITSLKLAQKNLVTIQC